MTPWLLNNAWQLSCRASAVRFERALENPEQVQERILHRMLTQNQASEFGRRHGFKNLRGATDFQDRVPLQTWDSLAPMIEAIAQGDHSILTRRRVTRLLPSSGSSAARKLIPYTQAYRDQLGRAISPWIHNLMATRPRIKSGRAFWSISPGFETTENREYAVPVGFEHDSAYLSRWSGLFARRLLALPPGFERGASIEDFRYRQLLHLLACGDLSLISIWHPSYLTLLLEHLRENWEALMRDLGEICADRGRLAWVRQVGCESYAKLWPDLQLISCWGSGHAAGALRELKALFPRTEFQEKGLLATEAVVSIPYFDNAGDRAHKVLAVNSHFLEFLRDDDEPKQVHELLEGETYRVVVTTAAGLYRYQLQDRIRVTGKLKRTPTIEFVGKEDSISDFRGEKLADSFVGENLRQLLENSSIDAVFSMLAPDETDGRLGYTLYLEARGRISDELAARLDARLGDNPHYRLCRKLGQLAPLRVFSIPARSNEAYLQRRLLQGCRLGDIKPVSLSPLTGWSDCFDGTYQTQPEALRTEYTDCASAAGVQQTGGESA